MRFAVYLPNCMHVAAITQPWEPSLTGREIARVAQTAEQLGYSMVFLPEHFLTPTPHLELSGNHYFDATTAQAFVAGATSTITVGSMVTILPLHNPVIAAKSIATLDWFSGGRAQVTVGVGWLKEEYDAVGVPFTKRGRIADECLAAMFELWHSDAPSYDGEFVKFDDMAFGPKPVHKPHPPIWMGGDADAVLRRAARFGDGWAPWLTKPDELPAKMDYLRSGARLRRPALLAVLQPCGAVHRPGARDCRRPQRAIRSECTAGDRQLRQARRVRRHRHLGQPPTAR
jgi:probable F420-dependent oxidoreductase